MAGGGVGPALLDASDPGVEGLGPAEGLLDFVVCML